MSMPVVSAPRSAAVRAVALWAALLAIAPAAWAAEAPTHQVTVATADTFLKPGDIIIKYVIGGEALSLKDKVTAKAIGVLATVTKWTRAQFNEAAKKGHVKAEHAMLYTGSGKVAESVGEGVRMGSLEKVKGLYLAVYRPADPALAKRAVEIATRWASSGRMKYAVPYGLAERSTFGPDARAEAMAYAKAANVATGPASVSRMICSQFVIAAYQSAAWEPLLQKSPGAKADALAMPFAFQMQASHSSPLILDGQLLLASTHAEHGVEVLGSLVVK